MRSRHLALCSAYAAALLVLLLAADPSQAQLAGAGELASQADLTKRLEALVETSGLKKEVGVSVVNLISGRSVFAHQAHTPRNPASNMKVLTAAVALKELGPDFRIRTGLYGHVQGEAVVGGLFLKSHGDPTLETADFLELARQLAARGVKRVDELRVDGSYFDGEVLPPAFEQQPDEVAPFRAAVGAVSVDRNAYTLRVRPGSAAGEPAVIDLTGYGYFDVENRIVTSEAGSPNIIAIQSEQDGKLDLKLRGKMPLGVWGISYRRRVASPLHYAGHVMVEALRAMRIQVPVRVSLAPTPPGAALLASQQSADLGTMMAALGKHSDNFVAEMLLKILGAERVRQPGRSADGAKVVLDTLKKLGVATTKLEIVNGSGLFNGNQVAPSHLTRVLLAVHQDESIRADFVAHLAVGGTDGTLSQRLTQLPAPRIVRAKTGTLNDVIALSGYVLGPSPERGMAFSVLAEGIRGRQRAARDLADAIVTAIANHLHAGPRAAPASVSP